ncbi:MAG: hypothetical protein AB1457_14165 [Chloroflexota bacterium]|nr:MAG: hypothetical protein KatS3mg045_1302 [Bellilinea sp.]
MWVRYHSASRKEKGNLLDKMQAVTGMHRKSLMRMLIRRLSRKPRRRARGRTCGTAVEDVVRVIARGLLDAPSVPQFLSAGHGHPTKKRGG